MKKQILIFSLIITTFTALAQQEPIISNYLSNLQIINTAATGINKNTEIKLLTKKHFIGIDDKNINFQALTVSLSNENYAMGVNLSNDIFGNTRAINMGLTYAYHLKISDYYNLAFALTPKFIQFGMNQSDYVYFDYNDNLITDAPENTLVFDADFGAIFYSDKIIAGLSVKNLFEPNVSLGANISDENKINRLIYLTTAYSHNINQTMKIQPSALVSYTNNLTYIIVGSRFHINNNFWLGAAYNTSSTFSAIFGMNYLNYNLSYSYDHSLSTLSKNAFGTHEIIIGIEIGQTNSKPRI